MASLDSKDIIDRLGPFLTEERKAKIEQVIAHRVFDVQILLENIYDRGNISAVMRTAEAFGIFQFQIVDNQENFKVSNRVTQGAERWLEMEEWQAAKSCVEHLKSRGFQLAVTDLNADLSIEKLRFDVPTVIAFGNERDGVSEELRSLSDMRFKIPMVGFTQSFNISVAAALCLQKIREQKKSSFSEEEAIRRENLKALYYQRAYEHSEKLLRV